MILTKIFNSTAVALRKVHRAKKFNRAKAARALLRQARDYWRGGVDSLFEFLGEHEGWEKIQRHCQLHLAGKSVEKALSDADRTFVAELLAKWGYYGDVAQQATAMIEETSVTTFVSAAQHALGQIGIEADFELRNEDIRERLLSRKDAAIFASRNSAQNAIDTVITNFYELGRNPYSQEFLDALRKDLGYMADYEAKRFALTETGIAAELAQIETYRRNGVQRKCWNITGANTRPTHEVLSGVEVAIGEKFDVGGFEADHPLDPRLPAEELVNCHCWVSPVVDDDFRLDPTKIWEGQ